MRGDRPAPVCSLRHGPGGRARCVLRADRGGQARSVRAGAEGVLRQRPAGACCEPDAKSACCARRCWSEVRLPSKKASGALESATMVPSVELPWEELHASLHAFIAPARAESRRCRRSGAARAAPDRQGTWFASRQRAPARLGLPHRAQRHRRLYRSPTSRREAAAAAPDSNSRPPRLATPAESEDETGGAPELAACIDRCWPSCQSLSRRRIMGRSRRASPGGRRAPGWCEPLRHEEPGAARASAVQGRSRELLPHRPRSSRHDRRLRAAVHSWVQGALRLQLTRPRNGIMVYKTALTIKSTQSRRNRRSQT